MSNVTSSVPRPVGNASRRFADPVRLSDTVVW